MGRGQCIGVASFLKGLGDAYVSNTCWVLSPDSEDVVGGVSQCDAAYMDLQDNTYATQHGNASLRCGSSQVHIADLYHTKGVGRGSKAGVLPSTDEMLVEISTRLGFQARDHYQSVYV